MFEVSNENNAVDNGITHLQAIQRSKSIKNMLLKSKVEFQSLNDEIEQEMSRQGCFHYSKLDFDINNYSFSFKFVLKCIHILPVTFY